MREILFRGKRLDNGEWVEGAYFKHDTVRVCLSSDDPKPKHLIVKDGFCDWGFEPGIIGIEVDPATVGQYTGLTDKNGKKIFEGDVIANPRIPWEVAFKHTAFVGLNEDGSIQFTLYDQHTWEYKEKYMNPPEYFEIIGNIHDNPKLLEEWF